MPTTATWPLLAASAAALSLSSCADNDTSLYVEAVLAPQPPDCNFTADPTADQLIGGVLDVGFASSYSAVVLVANQLTPRGEKNQLRTETHGVELRGAEVRLTDSEENVLEEFSTPTGGFVHPNSGDAPGYGFTRVTLIPPQRGQSLANSLDRYESRTVVANVRVFGDTLGGAEVLSGEFRFVIDVCKGCLVTYPTDAFEDPGDGRGPLCIGSAEGVTLEQCSFGRDALIDCRQCAFSHPDLCLSP